MQIVQALNSVIASISNKQSEKEYKIFGVVSFNQHKLVHRQNIKRF